MNKIWHDLPEKPIENKLLVIDTEDDDWRYDICRFISEKDNDGQGYTVINYLFVSQAGDYYTLNQVKRWMYLPIYGDISEKE